MRSVAALLALSTLLGAAGSNQIVEMVRKAGDDYRQGHQQEAEKTAAEALTLIDNSSAEPDFDVAAGLNNLGSLAYAKGELARARQLFERSRDIYLALAGPGDTRLASVLYNLAGVLVETGAYAEAEPLYRNALDVRKTTLGEGNPLVAEVWNALGFLSLQQKKYNESEQFLEKASNLWETATGFEAFLAVSLNNLAMLRRLQGKFDQAEVLYQRAVEVEQKNFGQDHPEVATTLMSLAALYRARGNGDGAAQTYRRALALIEKSLGAQDPLALEARARLAELGGPAEATGHYQILVVRTREEAEDLRRKIAAGQEFATLASIHSIDPNASTGGFFRARPPDLRPELRATLDPLPAGQVSAVFKLAANWAVVKKISDSGRTPK